MRSARPPRARWTACLCRLQPKESEGCLGAVPCSCISPLSTIYRTVRKCGIAGRWADACRRPRLRAVRYRFLDDGGSRVAGCRDRVRMDLLEMRVAIGTLTEKWRQLGHEIGFGIGIAHGYATLGTIGFEGRFDYAAIGTVSNVASRLCDEAKPGQILISPRVLMAVKDAVTVEAVGEFELKGIRRPIAAHNVLAASSQRP
jgi:class 3 adenylate cyclase